MELKTVDVILTLRMSDEDAQTLLADIAAHRRQDDVDGHRDHGVLLINTQDIVSATRQEV